MKNDGKSRLAILAVLIPGLALAQNRPERKCCPGEPGKADSTVYNPAGPKVNAGALADLAVDMKATRVDETGTDYVLHVRILNDMGDNCASTCSKAIILLPTETVLKEVKTKRRWRQCHGYVEVDLPMLCPEDPKKPIPPQGEDDPVTGEHYWHAVEFDVIVAKTDNPVGKCGPAFGVFVRGEVPDNSPQNNYWWWYRRCPSDAWDPGPPAHGPQP
jgi:hypothetical protein